MEQFKLLNYHKLIANFATNLVGAFVALIVYQYTGQLLYAVGYLVANNVFRLLFTLALKNCYSKVPQLLLLLRLIPFTLYNVFIFVIDANLLIGVIGVCLFNGLDYAMYNLSREVILNYSSLSSKSDKSIGVTRLFEQIGIIVALLLGGFLLDVNKTIVLIMSISIYTISCIPLLVFYIKCCKQKTFNRDATSNAVSTLGTMEGLKDESVRLKKKLLKSYFWVYFLFAFFDLIQTTYGLFVFSKIGEFSTAGILNAVFNCFYAVGFYVAGMINDKFDTVKLVSICCVVVAICSITLPFLNVQKAFIFVCIIYGILAFAYPFISLFVLERMLIKTRIMGCSNLGLFNRETGCVVAYVLGYACGFLGLIGIFAVTAVAMVSSAFAIPYAEEKTRQNLVNYLQNNEKTRRKTPASKKAETTKTERKYL